MSTTVSSMTARIAALEAGMAELRAENELLKMQMPLEALTAGLKAASPEEIAAFKKAAEGLGEAPAKKGKKAAKTAEEKAKKTTNPEGPAAWNAFINATWHEMAAEKGVVGEHDDAFKKAAGAIGITFAVARAEASRRKAELEGKEPKAPKEPKAKKAASPKPAASAEASPAPSAPASPKPEASAAPAPKSLPAPTEAQVKAATLEYDDEMREAIREENEGYGWEAVVASGQAGWLDPSTGTVHSYDASIILGAWDAAKGVFTVA
jgi:hypothetical protein